MGVLLLLVFLELWPRCPADGWISSEFGRRRHPVSQKMRFHAGIDIANVRGTAVKAPWGGTIVKIRRSRHAGLHVVIRSGGFRILLAHLDETLVSVGQWVPAGEVVGHMGRSGRATGPHLHLEVRRGGKPLDPTFALLGCLGASMRGYK